MRYKCYEDKKMIWLPSVLVALPWLGSKVKKASFSSSVNRFEWFITRALVEEQCCEKYKWTW